MSIFPDRKKWRHPSLAMSYRVQRWYAGYYPALLSRLSRARTPSFFFVREKERRGRKKKPTGTFPAWGIPLSASRQPLCRCGLRSPAREIQTFSARVAIGTPANNHAAARSAFYQPRLAPASPHAPKSRATNSPGAPLHKENKETKGDALPLPVSPA